jgi:cytokinin dehydrogenase
MERRISRREFGKRLATGAALLALHPSCTSTQPSLPKGQLLRNDLTDLSGTLLLGDAERQAAADDFGHIVHRMPVAVLRPGSVDDVVKLVRFANQRGVKVAMRGNGHAMFGQAQVDTGVVIDSSTLNSVRVIDVGGRPAIEAGPGALWGAVLDMAYARKLTPPVTVPPLPFGRRYNQYGWISREHVARRISGRSRPGAPSGDRAWAACYLFRRT